MILAWEGVSSPRKAPCSPRRALWRRVWRAIASWPRGGTVAALQSAEAGKSAFFLENDPIATALLAYLANAGSFSGTAKELAPRLIATDSDLADRLSARRLGKRLAALWPPLQKALAIARREMDRNGILSFTFKVHPAGFAGFQTAFSYPPPSRSTH